MKSVTTIRDRTFSGTMISAGRGRSITPGPHEIRGIFGAISGRYALMNTMMSLGRDRSWRRHLIGEAALRCSGRLLDIGAGTGDIVQVHRRLSPKISG